MFKYVKDVDSGVVRKFDMKRKADRLVYEKCLASRHIEKKGNKFVYTTPRYMEIDEPTKEVKKPVKNTKKDEE
jgi:hypothetical protein